MKKSFNSKFFRVLLMLFMLLNFSSSVWAAKIYLNTNEVNDINWGKDNAWFFAHIWSDGGSSSDVKMTSAGNGYYSCDVPDDKNKIIFVRKNPSNSELNFNNKWGQTKDLTIPTDGNNLFTPNGWDNCDGTWSTYEEEDFPDALPDAVVCGKKTILFFEDFGTLDGETIRKQNNQIDGQNFYTSYNYIAECAQIKNAGEYAIVATPRWSGCSSKQNKDYVNTCACGNTDTGKWWYNTYYDHTQGGLKDGKYGGMLQFDCRNGSSTDVLYQRTVSGVCSNTLVNFSAWVTKANISGADPIKARFILRKGGADGTIIGRKDIDDIKINEGWKQISAMFNSDALNTDGEITIQLINLAPYGKNGNDILLDDLELSVCTPKATLTTSNGLTSITLTKGQPETLTAELVSGVMTNPFYLWQYKNDIQDWTPVLNVNGEPASGINKVTATVVPERPNTEYRVIVAPKSEDAYKVARDQGNTIPCGMYAITTIATIDVTISDLELTTSITDGNICVDGVDFNEITLTVKNPRPVAVTDVKVNLENIANLQISKNSGTGTYSNGVWTVENIDSKGFASIVLKVSSNTSVSTSTNREIKSYISSVSAETPTTLKKIETTIKLIPIPAPPTLKNNGIYDECATTGDISLGTLFEGTSLKYYSDVDLTTVVPNGILSASTLVKDKPYYATQTVNGCTSAAAVAKVTVKELPKLTSVVTNKTAICGTESDSKATLTYKFEGGTAPYTLFVQRTEDGGETETITPSNLSATGTYDLQPTAKTTYKFTQLKDVNGCISQSASGLVDDVVIDVKRLSITSNLNDESVCADKKITYTIGAEGDDIKYQWYESTNNGSPFNKVGTNSSTYTTDKFAMGDTKQYKVVVSQNLDPEVCSSITSAVSAVTVNDCSSFELAYTSVKNVVCKDGTIDLKLTLTNNSAIDATNVNVKISNLANQELEYRSSTDYTHSTGIWEIASLGKGKSVTLTIQIKGTVVVKDLVSVAYISKSGSTTYTETTTQAKDTETITVKDITAKPTVNNYAACPKEGMLDLVDQVTSDKTDLVFYTTEDGFASKTQTSKNAVGTTSYWVTNTNTKAGECESERTKLDIQVYPQPTAAISGSETICKGKSANLSIALTGTEKYDIVLSSGDGERQVTGSSTTIAVSPTTTTTYTLRTVTDGNGCYATLSGSATITVNDKPAVEVTQNPTQNVCDGDALTLPSVSVDANGSTVTSTKWYFNGKEYNEGDKVEYSDAIAEQELTLEYEATNSCGSTKVDAGKFIIRPRPELVSLEITDDDNIICEGTSTTTLKATFKGTAPFTFYVNGKEKRSDSANWSMTISEAGTYTISSLSDKYCAAVELTDNVQTLEVEKLPVVSLSATDVTLNCNNPSATITASGAKTYVWSYNDQSGATQTKTGETLDVQLSASASGKFTTTYTVYGYSEKANCKSAAPVTVKVTENKRKPEVKTLISATSLDETIEGYKETKVVTCEDTELFIKATIVDNVQVGYTAEELTYDWTYSEDGDVFEAKGTGETISTTTKGFFRLVVTDKETGCTSEQKIIEITENLAKPVITYIESYETLVPSGTGIKENDVLTCAKSVIYLNPTIESENEVTYKWTKQGSDNVISTDKILEVDKAGVYTLEVTDKTSFCSSSEVSFTVTENKRTPVISEIISANAQEETVEGYKETTVITCKDSELFIKATVVDNVAEGYSPEELTYDWTVSYDDGETFEEYSSAASIPTTEPGIFRLTVKDKATGCTSAQETITITQDLVKPTVELKTKPQQDGSPMSTELNCRLKSIPVMADTVNTPVEVVKFEWSNGASTNEFNDFTEKGTYIVTVTGENGCTASSTLEITENIVKPIPSVDYIGSRSNEQTTILNCNDQYIKVTPSVSNLEEIGGSVQYFWYQDGDEYYYGETLDVSESGKYLITAVGANNCEADIELELTMDIDTPDASIKASADTITCSTPDVELTVETDVDCTYFWTGIGNSDASAQTITVSEGGTYSVFVQSNVNGCMTTLTHTLEQRTDLPTVTVSSSQDKVTCIANTLTASGASTYVWSSGEATESIEVTSGGTYTVTGTNEYGCENTAEIILEEDQVSPEITLTADTTHITCRKESVILTAEVENADASRAYSYEWAQGSEESDVTTNTFEAEADATYKVTVTDTANACTSEETIVVNENKQTPTIVTQSLTAVCLPAAVDIAEALSETNADAVKYYADKDLTQEVTNTSVEAASGAKYYVVGYEVDNNGCVSVPVEIALNVKPVSATPVVNNYDACAVEGTKTLSSLVTSDKTNLVFFADATSEEPIADEFDASAENTSTTYWVINTAANSCVSERVEFTVDIAGYIDFTIEASETRVPAGNDVTITVTPLTETPVNQYIWYRNDGEILSGDETTLTEQLYLTSKYAVQAIGRCNSPKQEVDIEAVWPTAFTPHNDNGKNDEFAKGMPIIVFNRFYTKIFEGPDGWDGTINGTMNDSKNIAVPGVYYYKVDLPNGEVKKGTIEIVR